MNRLWILLLFCTVAQAQRVRYADTGSAGGDGTTPGVAGANAAYVSLSACLAAEFAADSDVTDEGGFIIHLNRTNGGGKDTTTLTIAAAWVTSAAAYLTITQDDFPSDGIWDDTAYVIHNNDSATAAVQNRESFVRFENLQWEVTETSTNTRYGLNVTVIDTGASDVRVTNCIFRGQMSGTGVGIGINVDDADAIVTVANTTVYDFYIAADVGFRGVDLVNGTCSVFNSTLYNCTRGIGLAAGSTMTVKNCAIGACTDGIYDAGGTLVVDYCCDDDDDGTNNQDPSGAAWTNEFVNLGSKNFTLKAGGNCVDNGTADPGGAAQDDDDIIGTARPQGDSWDIGAYELVASGTTDIQRWWHRRRQ